MTEEKWNACVDIRKMLDFVTGDRKKRLFACACVRQIWHLLDDRSKQAVIVSEKYADGLVDIKKLHEAKFFSAYSSAHQAASTSASEAAWYTPYAVATADAYSSNTSIFVSRYVPLLKDIFDPFNKFKKPQCRSYTKEFAKNIYQKPNEKGELLDLEILSDMLIDDCADQALVDHLRTGKHFRGCQVIDLVICNQ